MTTQPKLTAEQRQKLLRVLKFGPRLSRADLAKWVLEQAKKAA